MKKIVFLLISLCALFTNMNASQSDINKIKQRVIESILRGSNDDAKSEDLIKSLHADGTWPNIDYKDVSREGFQHAVHLSNMLHLARSYNTKSSKFYKKKQVIQTIESALKNWTDNDYFCENWWHNQINTPSTLVSLMLLVGDELDPQIVEKIQPIIGRGNITASGARPSGDRIKIAGIEAKNMLFTKNYDKFDELIHVIEGEIKFVHWIGMDYSYPLSEMDSGLGSKGYGGRGIQYDNSFHHRWDGVNNTLSYGLGYADSFVEWAEYVEGTSYEFSEDKINQLVDYYLDGICKHAVFGKYPDMGAKNRSISRSGFARPFGPSTPLSLLIVSNYRNDELQEIANVRLNKAKTTLSHATFYWNTEHFTFQCPSWYTSVRMYSTRNFNMEVPYNSEGLLNHHRGDGANHVYRKGDEYYDISPVFDFQKIPGTTVMQKPELPAPDEIQKLGLTDFVGAVTDGQYGAVAFDFESPHDPLLARKAWFFFDKEYVSLGTGISCNKELHVATTVNQCLLRGDVIISSQNNKSTIENDEKAYKDIDWVFHDGIGYVFPKGTDLNIKNNNATGSWWEINKQHDSPKEEVNLDIFTLWIDHGKRPSKESYEYIVVPATTEEQIENNISKNNIQILSNTPNVQAVKNRNLNIVQAVFYEDGEVQIAKDLKLISDNQGVIMIKTNGDDITEMSVADPSRKLRKMHFSLSTKKEQIGNNFNMIWNERTNMTDVTIDLPDGDYTGSSVTIKL